MLFVERTWKSLLLRYDDICDNCGAHLTSGSAALWSPTLRKVHCIEHSSDSPEASVAKEPEIDRGTPGASARAKYEWEKSSYERRFRKKYPRIGGALLALRKDPPSARPWRKGAKGEADVGKCLEKLATKYNFVTLHDRRIPRSRANIDHIAVTRSGVYVIDAKNYQGSVRVMRPGGFLSSKSPALCVGSRNCTNLVNGLKKQVAAVTWALMESGSNIRTMGVLAFFYAKWPLFMAPTEVDGILINGRGIKKILARPGDCTSVEISNIARLLAISFPAYISPTPKPH